MIYKYKLNLMKNQIKKSNWQVHLDNLYILRKFAEFKNIHIEK